MRDIPAPTRLLRENVMVRQRCIPCEVAWSGPADEVCWVCGQGGSPLNTAVIARERGELVSFDLELFA